MASTTSRQEGAGGGPSAPAAGRDEMVLWSILDQAFVSAASFLIGILAARLLGPVEFGKLVQVQALAVIGAAFSDYVLGAPMMTLAGGRARRTAPYFAALLAWSAASGIAGGLLAAAAAAALLGWRDGTVPTGLAIAAFSFTAAQALNLAARRVLFARRDGRGALALDIARHGGLVLALLAALWMPVALTATSTLAVMAALALAASLPFLVRLLGIRLEPRLLRALIARHWPEGRWLLLMFLVSLGHEQLIVLIVGAVLGDMATAGLRVGQYLLGVTHFLLLAMANFVPRRAAEVHAAKGSGALAAYLVRQTWLLGAPMAVLILLIVVPGRQWLTLAFGPGYIEYVDVLRIYGLVYIAIFVREVWVFYLRTVAQARQVAGAYALSSAVAVLAAYPVLVSNGVIGAAWLILAATTLSAGYVLWEVIRHRRATAST